MGRFGIVLLAGLLLSQICAIHGVSILSVAQIMENKRCEGRQNMKCSSTADCQMDGCNQYLCSTMKGGYCMMTVWHSGLKEINQQIDGDVSGK